MAEYEKGITCRTACDAVRQAYLQDFEHIKQDHLIEYSAFVQEYGQAAADPAVLTAKANFYRYLNTYLDENAENEWVFEVTLYHPHDLAYGRNGAWYTAMVDARTGLLIPQTVVQDDMTVAQKAGTVLYPFALQMPILLEEYREEFDDRRGGGEAP